MDKTSSSGWAGTQAGGTDRDTTDRDTVPSAGRFASARRIDRQGGVLKAKFAVLLLAALLGGLPAPAQEVALDRSIVTDPLTGTALMGFDVVSYFIENRAAPGDPAQQAQFAGRAWYFTSAANRTMFLDRPEAFQPVFGGYDASALAAGVLRPGDPAIFLLHDGRLYFFRDAAGRDRAVVQPEVLEAAAREWPTLRRDLGL